MISGVLRGRKEIETKILYNIDLPNRDKFFFSLNLILFLRRQRQTGTDPFAVKSKKHAIDERIS